MWYLYILLMSLGTCLNAADRRLQQADGPGIVDRPVSATSSDLVNDPTGRAHLLVLLARCMIVTKTFNISA